jgi:phospholipid/cholesterol/gamma-HCH transport system permease protein
LRQQDATRRPVLRQVNLSAAPGLKKHSRWKGIQILPSQPLLTATPSGDVLELRPGGSWTAANVTTLEALSDAVTEQVDRSKSIKVDMAEVRELDTLGAWLLEKISRRATSAGHRAEVVGVADNYAGLIEEVRQVNRRNSVPPPALSWSR